MPHRPDMPERKETAGKGERGPAKVGGFRIACSEEGCGATTEITFSGPGPYQGAALSDAGWAVLNSPEDSSIIFLCPTCFKQAEEEEGFEDDEIDEAPEDNS